MSKEIKKELMPRCTRFMGWLLGHKFITEIMARQLFEFTKAGKTVYLYPTPICKICGFQEGVEKGSN
jgi:hypothetical protein